MEFDDYKKELLKTYHARIQKLCWILSIIVLAAELAVFALLLHAQTLDMVPSLYFLEYVLLPSLINFITTIVLTGRLADRRLSMRRRNWLSCFSLLVIVTVISAFHNYFPVMLALPCIPIFVSAIFTDKKLSYAITGGALIGTAISVVSWIHSNASGPLVFLILNGAVCALVVLCCHFIATLIMKSQQDQVDFIYGAFMKQQDLIEELNIEPMTKLYNKTALTDCLKLYIQKFLNGEFTPHLVLIDIDHFKDVNDVYGHNAGDAVLIRLAELIRDKMGGSRRAFRFGGDEMVLLFGSESLEQIQDILEELRSEFKGTAYDFRPENPITLSIGVAAYYKGLSEKQWFELADSTMYRSKTNGRDKIYIA